MLNASEAAAKRALTRALLISLGALLVPVLGTFLVPESLSDYEALLWLLALIPAFLLAYHRAWRGVATSMAFGMAVLSITYAVAQSLGRQVPDLLFGVVVLLIVFGLMIGWLAERFHRDVRRGRIEGAEFTDKLTGLPNRKHADLHVQIEASAAEGGRALSVVALDIDHFKAYNSRHGTSAGDEVLRLVANALRQNTRRLNLSARYDDDEFVSILGGSDEDGALVFMSRFQDTVTRMAGELRVPPISAGIATFRPGMGATPELIAAAEEALKRAKKEGTGRVRVHGRTTAAPIELAGVNTEAGVEDDAATAMPEGRGTGRKALIVIEEVGVRGLLARYLGDHGFMVAQVSNVVDGVQCLSVEYDLLIADISLSEGYGAELVRAAKTRWPSIQVLGLAQIGEGVTAIDALNAGVDRFIEKPLDLPKLRQHLTELLERRDQLVASVLENRQLTLEFQAEKAAALDTLRRREEEYRSVVESLHEIIFRLDANGDFTFLNWAWTATTGHTVADSLGKPAVNFVHAAQHDAFDTMLRALLDGDLDEARAELRLMALDGRVRTVELRAQRTFTVDGIVNGASGTMDDVTLRKETEEQLRRTEEMARALFTALPDEVFGLSRNGVFVNYEPGKDNHAVSPVGKALEEVFPGDVAERYRGAMERLLATREVQVCEYQLEKEEVVQEYEARLALSGPDEFVAIVRNISDQKRLEEQLRQSQKLEAIGRLAGGLAHDFNNLLTVVQGNAHLIIEEFGNNENALEFAQQISSAASRGADLVRQLLAFGRRQVLQPRVLSLNSIVSSVHTLLPRLLGEDIILDLDLAGDLGLVKADPGQLEQVVVSLAAFAKARMPSGGSLRVQTRNALSGSDYDPVVVGLDSKPLVQLIVDDTGKTLDENTRANVFEPFFGSVGAAQTGLGLATVYGIVTQSGGAILVDDAPNGGARFQILLPRVDAA